MRKTVPFILTVIVSVLCTATLVRAASSGTEAPLEASSLAASQVLGSALSLNTCNVSPDNAAEWTKFAKCMTGNVTRIQKWGRTLDNCFQVYKVATRADDLYGDPGDFTTWDNDPGLAPWQAGPFNYYVGWKDRPLNCPVAP
jgi:hypothetical protein